MKAYDLAKLCQRVRKAQKAYFATAKKMQGQKGATTEAMKAMRKLEFELDHTLYEEWPARESFGDEFAQLVELAAEMRNAQKKWIKERTDRTRWAAMAAERQLDKRAETIADRYEVTPSLFDQEPTK